MTPNFYQLPNGQWYPGGGKKIWDLWSRIWFLINAENDHDWSVADLAEILQEEYRAATIRTLMQNARRAGLVAVEHRKDTQRGGRSRCFYRPSPDLDRSKYLWQ